MLNKPIIKTVLYYLLSGLSFTVICSMVIYPFLVMMPQNRGSLVGKDFRAYYTAGLMSEHNVRGNFYSLQTQYLWQKSFVPEMNGLITLLPFLNPPFMLVLLNPLAKVSFQQAYFLWSLVNIFILVGLSYFCLRLFANREKLMKLFILFGLLLFAPFWETLIQGQLSFLLTLAMILSFYFWKYDKHFLTGLCLSILFIKPSFILVPFFLFFLKKQWSIVVGFIAGISFLCIGSWLVVGQHGVEGYIHLLVTASIAGNMYGLHPQAEPTIKSILLLLFHTYDIGKILWLWISFSLVCFFLLLRTWKNDKSNQQSFIQWSQLILVMLLTSSHANLHDMSLLALVLLFLLQYMLEQKSKVYMLPIILFLYSTLQISIFNYGVHMRIIAIGMIITMMYIYVLKILLDKRLSVHNPSNRINEIM